MADNDLLSRDIKTPFTTDWVYILNNAGTQEGRATIDDILALSDKEINTSSNTGTGVQLAKAKLGVDLPFRTLISSDASVTLSQGSDEIDITTTAEANTASNSGTGVGLAQPKVDADLPFRSLLSSDGTVSFVENTDDIDLTALRVGVYRNIFITAGAMISQSINGATAGTLATPTNDIMSDFYDFAPSVDSFVQFNMAMPDEWDTIAGIAYKVYWTNSGAVGAGDVRWGVSATAIDAGDSIDTAFSSFSTGVPSTWAGGANVLQIAPVITSVVSGMPNIGERIQFQIRRFGTNVSDTYTQTARLLGVAIQYKELTTEPVVWT